MKKFLLLFLALQCFNMTFAMDDAVNPAERREKARDFGSVRSRASSGSSGSSGAQRQIRSVRVDFGRGIEGHVAEDVVGEATNADCPLAGIFDRIDTAEEAARRANSLAEEGKIKIAGLERQLAAKNSVGTATRNASGIQAATARADALEDRLFVTRLGLGGVAVCAAAAFAASVRR